MIPTGELHSRLMVIQTYIRCIEEFDARSIRFIRVTFDSTAARFTAYLTKYHTKHLVSRLVHVRAINKEKRLIAEEIDHLHTSINALYVTSGPTMNNSFKNRDYSPVSMTKHDTTYTYDSTSENSSFNDGMFDDTTLDDKRELEQPQSIEAEESEAVSPMIDAEDETIAKAWIPRNEVVIEAFVSRGAFGEVYRGTYKGETVAVKTMSDMERFMKEIKMVVALSHSNIVQFIGVAWNYRQDLCCVMEFMDGGDLRTLLDHYETETYPIGFGFQKLLIAYQVARALVYMHSRDVPVIHRDLKSKNILLTQELDAKVTDFGMSRDRVVGPMTANVGTSLWMAPEVMLGNPYDETADMFSFGVVLSELSVHALPYSHTKVCSGGNSQLVILRRVAMGDLRVDFADTGPQAVAKLGRSCVSMDVKERPTAVEAMHVLHAALQQEARMEVIKTCSL
uniref:Protein kinase domain-containing protein n=1 Tax=Peronospora matthiolae TaxID=2874970 RepID=A0AAV1V5N6_9STRA